MTKWSKEARERARSKREDDLMEPPAKEEKEIIKEEEKVMQIPPNDLQMLPSLPALESSYSPPIEQESNAKSIGKELFSKDDINVKTQLDHDEINMIVKLHFLSTRFQVRNIEDLTQNLEELRVSMDRQGRKEFVESIKADRQQKEGTGFLSRLFKRRPNESA